VVERLYALGLDGGASKTEWLLWESSSERVAASGQAAPGNLSLLTAAEFEGLLSTVAEETTGLPINAVGGFFAGCRTQEERLWVEEKLSQFWPSAGRVLAGDDTEAWFAAAFGQGDGVLVLAGTGSHVIGRREGRWERAGGWGHLFGDRGSAYDLVRRTLEELLSRYDLSGTPPKGLAAFLAATGEPTPEALVRNVFRSGEPKRRLAALAPYVFELAHQGDRIATAVICQGSQELARRAWRICQRLRLKSPNIILAGGVFAREPFYVESFARAFAGYDKKASLKVCSLSASLGAAWLAAGRLPYFPKATVEDVAIKRDTPKAKLLAKAWTEKPNSRSRHLEKRTVAELVDLFLSQERWVMRALWKAKEKLVAGAELVSAKLLEGGRLFYVGAGTSGRLAVVDASEIPPTFGTSPLLVQAILAGGSEAFFQSREGAEDQAWAGAQAIRYRGVEPKDVVCGISASGQTPFVLGALKEAWVLGASTLLVTCNPNLPPCPEAALVIDLPTGPEVIAGSTRLKAGTATKIVLNMLTSIAMIRLGRVQDNLMICMVPKSEKLRQRAIRLLQRLCHVRPEEAQFALEKTGWQVKQAVEMLCPSKDKKA
jgi:N-acetylmuramic acid 6-phosphate etherase